MKFTLSWLKDYLDTDASLDEISQTLTDIGLEVEEINNPAEKYAPFKAAYVEKADPHPDADRLKVCLVDTGNEKIQVVCGAPNAKAGMMGIFAPAGAYVPGTDLLLKKGKIRGQQSNGMLVSEREMGLSDEHQGIIELSDDVKIGTAFTDIYNMNDPIIEIALTPNRADCASIYGIARDLAAAGLGTLKSYPVPEFKESGQGGINVHIDDKEGCSQFFGRLIKDIENKESPAWLQSRLKAIGLRPISALVDITNYMTIAFGRPLHVYDADLLKSDITVRVSKKGESFEALNDKSYTLEDGMTAITDENGLLGLGGIVGGTSTGVSETTKNVFLESAYFDPYRIAKTGRALQVDSDARYRFERGVDPEFTQNGLDIGTSMILEICGGTACEHVVSGSAPQWKREIEFDAGFTKKLAGIDIAEDKQKDILQTLGFELNGNKAQPPSWRGDVEGKADLVEEVTRIYGYDKIEPISVVAVNATGEIAETPSVTKKRLTRTALAARGLQECVTWSFMGKELAQSFGGGDEALTLLSPISSDLDQMRPSILGNLLSAANQNADKKLGDAAFFEVGPVFASSQVDGQQTVATGLRFGNVGARHWTGAEGNRDHDVYDVKADAIAALDAAGAPTSNLQTAREASEYFHPGRSAVLKLGKNVLAQFGEIHPAILEEMDIKQNAVAFEVFLDNIPEAKKKGTSKALVKLSQFQPVNRDFAFIVDENVDVENITRAAKGAEQNLITDVSVFDIYQGKGVDEGKKSIAINVTIQPVKQTLTDAEIDGLSQKIIDAVSSKTGATLRG
ncbi:MAG: phenylalanine--tRNA ligase subunit beta [Pseudomonadota bacterium]